MMGDEKEDRRRLDRSTYAWPDTKVARPDTEIAIPTRNRHDTDKSDTTDTRSDTITRNRHEERQKDDEETIEELTKSLAETRRNRETRSALRRKLGEKESIRLATHRAQYK